MLVNPDAMLRQLKEHLLVEIVLFVTVSVLSSSGCLLLLETVIMPVTWDTSNSHMSNLCTSHCNDQSLGEGRRLRRSEFVRRIEPLAGC